MRQCQNAKVQNAPSIRNSREHRTFLSSTPTGLVILLPFPFEDNDYDQLVTSIKPAIIATTKGDPSIHHKIRQAKKIGAQVVEVIDRLPNHSTTQLINTL